MQRIPRSLPFDSCQLTRNPGGDATCTHILNMACMQKTPLAYVHC
jgi:hypothetical protein